MIEHLWLVAPLVLFATSAAFMAAYWPAFWPNRHNAIAANLMTLAVVLAIESMSTFLFRITGTEERWLRVWTDVALAGVIVWRVTQVVTARREDYDQAG